MKELREYLFSKIRKETPVWYYTENIDAKMSEFTADFIELTGEENSDKFSGKLLADIHTLQFVAEDNKTHYFSFYSLYGSPKRIINNGLINRITNNDSLGLLLYSEEEVEEPTAEEALSNIIPDEPKKEMLYFVYRNSRKEVQIINMKDFKIESYLDKTKIVDETVNNLGYMDGHLIVEVTYTMTDKNEAGDNIIRKYLYTINETYDNINDNTNDVNLVSFNIYNLLENDTLANENVTDVNISIKPLTYDVFEVNIVRSIADKGFINTVYIYSSKYNSFINKFNINNEPNVAFKVLNIIGDIDNGSMTILFKDKHDHETNEIINDILLSTTKATSEEEFDKYYILPEAHKMLLKKVTGADIIYTVTQDSNNPNAESMSQFNFFSIENGKLKIDSIKSRSIPTDIHLNEESGMLMFIYAIDMYYHMICYFYDGIELMKYSNVQLYPTDNVEEAMLEFKNHLKKIEKSQTLLKDEMEQLHHYHTMLLSTDSDGKEFITSSHFVNLTTNEVNYDLTKMNITKSGKFLELREDKSTKLCMRVQSKINPKEEIIEELKELQNTLKELEEE